MLILGIQGLILGGVFYQLADDIKHVSPINFQNDWMNSDWAKSFLYGIDGNGAQPFVDIITAGVDGHNSRPIMTLLEDTQFMLTFHTVLQCVHTEMKIPLLGYPTNSYDPPDVWPAGLGMMEPTVNKIRRLLPNYEEMSPAGATDLVRIAFP